MNVLCMNLNPIDIRGRHSAHDDKWMIRHSVCTEAAWRTLHRGPGLSPIGMNMIGLASRFGSIIVKC